jgi:ribosomal protein S14
MKAALLRSKKQRELFYKNELLLRIKKVLFIQFLNTQTEKRLQSTSSVLCKFNFFFSKYGSKSLLRNRCVLSNRSNSINKDYNLSRIIFRQFLQQGIIPGGKKAVW